MTLMAAPETSLCPTSSKDARAVVRADRRARARAFAAYPATRSAAVVALPKGTQQR